MEIEQGRDARRMEEGDRRRRKNRLNAVFEWRTGISWETHQLTPECGVRDRVLMMTRVVTATMALLVLASAAVAAPSARDVLHRVLTANDDAPSVTSADVLFKLRVKKSLSDPPDCEFTGTMQLSGGHESVRIGQRTAGLLCWAVNQYVLGKLFEASEPMEGFLSRFEFHVLGEKLVGSDHYYLVQGKGRDPNNNPRAMTGWIDYGRGLITDGTLEYTWGTVETEQRYTRVNGAWVLVYQLLRSSRFDATLEISYSNFRFAR